MLNYIEQQQRGRCKKPATGEPTTKPNRCESVPMHLHYARRCADVLIGVKRKPVMFYRFTSGWYFIHAKYSNLLWRYYHKFINIENHRMRSWLRMCASLCSNGILLQQRIEKYHDIVDVSVLVFSFNEVGSGRSITDL